jgi:hypothetical protein
MIKKQKNRRKEFLHCNIITNKITLLTAGYVTLINQLSAIVSSTQTSVDSNPGLVPGFFWVTIQGFTELPI